MSAASRPTEIAVSTSSVSGRSVPEREVGIRETDVTIKAVVYVKPVLTAHVWTGERGKIQSEKKKMAQVLQCAYSGGSKHSMPFHALPKAFL